MAPQFKAHPKHPAVDYLVRLHADIGGHILENQKQAQRLADDMKSVEAVIRMFDPAFHVAEIAPRRRVTGNPWFRRGTLFRRGLEVLRTATKPLCARDIMLGMLAAKGITDATPHQIRVLTNGLTRSLMNNNGRTVETVGEGSPMRWKLIQ
jgi:hypothetical protein